MKGIDESRIVLRKRLLEDKCTKSVFRKQISLCFNLPERFARSRLLILYSHVRQRAAAALAAAAAVA